jgi:hypothetical protein
MPTNTYEATPRNPISSIQAGLPEGFKLHDSLSHLQIIPSPNLTIFISATAKIPLIVSQNKNSYARVEGDRRFAAPTTVCHTSAEMHRCSAMREFR